MKVKFIVDGIEYEVLSCQYYFDWDMDCYGCLVIDICGGKIMVQICFFDNFMFFDWMVDFFV